MTSVGAGGGIKQGHQYVTKSLARGGQQRIRLQAAAQHYGVTVGDVKEAGVIRQLGNCHTITEPGHILLIPRKAYVIANQYQAISGECYMEISLVCTAAAARRQGLAKKLVRAMLLFAHYEGIRIIMAQATNAMGRILESLGFYVQDESQLMENWGDWADWQTSPNAVLTKWKDRSVPKLVRI